ncbi:MAG: ABC transporter ATP-binding protein [Candidatus Fimadaptatus sp.]|jgi:ABC-2 type transport system ATP-binding protein
MNALEMRGVVKSYDGKRNAVDGVTLDVPQGGVFGFLGPNGAGKTTTVMMLSGLLAPSSGELRVEGIDPVRQPERVHAISALSTEHTRMYDHMTGSENLKFFGRLYGMSECDIAARSAELLRELELDDARDRKLGAYSTGMRQRLSLARVLMHRPKVLFLDEPTSGLDPESVQSVNELISRQGREGATVFLCTHQLRYAQEICTRYGLMSNGHLLSSGTFEQLEAQVGARRRVRLRCGGAQPQGFERLGEGRYEADAQDDAQVARLIAQAVRGGTDIYEVTRVRDSLEDLYFALLKRHEGGGQG